MPKGRKWTVADIRLLGECVKNKISYKQMHTDYFPERSPNAIKQAVRKHFDDADYSKSKFWTTGELNRLRQLVEELRYDNWSDLARHMPNRSAAACKQAAEKHLTPPRS